MNISSNAQLAENNKLRRMATFASIGVASVLILAKLVAYAMTDSISVLTSLFDSSFDLVASLVTAYGVASAMRPPDKNHRFGHGKAEPLAALAQSIFVLGSSIVLAYEAVVRFYHPKEIANEAVGYAVMSFSIAMTLALVVFQHRVVRKTGSAAIGADRLHYVSDLSVNLAVMVAFALQKYTGLTWFDPLFAFGISLALLYSAVKILRQALFSLMDAEIPEEQRKKIIGIVMSQDGVQGVHDLRTRSDSDRIFIEAHVEMDGELTLHKAHIITERICGSIAAEIPNADVLIHQDPVGIEEFRLDAQIEKNEA